LVAGVQNVGEAAVEPQHRLLVVVIVVIVVGIVGPWSLMLGVRR
jgi:hypothetical protein